MRNVLIASGAFSDLCRLIAGTLRPLMGSGKVSYCFGDQLEKLRERDRFDLSDFGFLILRLSPHSHQEESETYKIESGLVEEALRRRIPIGIVCDPAGNITAPYLKGDNLNRIVLVVTNGPNEGQNPAELYENAGIFDLGLGGKSPADVAAFIARQLPGPRPIRSEPTMMRPHMAASNSARENYTD